MKLIQKKWLYLKFLNHYSLQLTSQKYSYFDKIQTELKNIEKQEVSDLDLEELEEELEKRKNILNEWEEKIMSIQNENKILIIELSSLGNQLSIKSEERSERKKKVINLKKSSYYLGS